MRCRHNIIPIILLFAALNLAASAYSQDYSLDTRPPRGFMPTADQLSSPVDSIDPVSGKLNIQIPLASMPRGRGGIGFDLNLQYDSHIYDLAPGGYSYSYVDENGAQHNNIPVSFAMLGPQTSSGGWTYNAKNYLLELETKANTSSLRGCPEGNDRWQRLRLVLPDGSMHILHLRGYEGLEQSQDDGFLGLSPDGKSNDCAASWGWAAFTGWMHYYTVDGSYLREDK